MERIMKILLVDDSENDRETLKLMLEDKFDQLGLPLPDFIEVCNGWSAYRFLKDGLRPDFTIVDYDMPNMNGIELIDKILCEFSDPEIKKMKIAVYSGYSKIRHEAERRGCHFFMKIVDNEALYERAIFYYDSLLTISGKPADRNHVICCYEHVMHTCK